MASCGAEQISPRRSRLDDLGGVGVARVRLPAVGSGARTLNPAHPGRAMIMKKLLVVCAVVLCLGFGTLSAARASLPVQWDVRMGPSLTGLTGVLSDSLDRAGGGFDAGVAIRWPRSSSLVGIQAEVLFASRSRSFEDVVGFRRYLHVDYVQIPLLARASLARRGTKRPYALVGPFIAWRASSNIQPGHYVGDEPVNPSDVRVRDAGAIIGLGSDVVTSGGRATFELRLGLGLVDVLEDRTGIPGAFRVVTLLLGFNPSRGGE